MPMSMIANSHANLFSEHFGRTSPTITIASFVYTEVFQFSGTSVLHSCSSAKDGKKYALSARFKKILLGQQMYKKDAVAP